MHIPFIRQFKSALSPWDIYRALYPHARVSFFLDSHDYVPPNQTFSYIGFRPYLEVTLRHERLEVRGEINKTYPAAKLFQVLRHLLKEYEIPSNPSVPFFAGGAVGYWGYELVTLFEKIKFRPKPAPRIPALALGFYRDLIVYDHAKRKYWLVVNLFSKKGLSGAEKQKQSEAAFENLKRYFDLAALRSKKNDRRGNGFHLKRFCPDVSKSYFENMVKRAKKYIVAGDIYQANLSQRFSFQFRGSPVDLYGNLRKINPSPFASFLKIGNVAIVSSSPERLIRKRGRWCETLPIAGTRPRRSGNRGEKKIVRDLLNNEKERAEHIMLVDLERNDLGRVCRWPTVKVNRMMTIEKYSHVIHLVSKIVGKLKNGRDAFDLICAMFPGGTITGCPKIRCMQIIDELEPVGRGIYTGSVGYVDFYGNLDLNIVIRTLVIQKNKGCLQVGAGIVYDSDPAREYEETLHKGEALVEALVKTSVASGKL